MPALIPSWRFFDIIAPSPRIEYALLENASDQANTWKEFRPRPQKLPSWSFIYRLFFNAHWNESLFLMSCAERLIQNPSAHSENEIFTRLMDTPDIQAQSQTHIQFRLIFLSKEPSEERLNTHLAYTSPIREIKKGGNHGI